MTLTRLAARLDTWGGARKAKLFRKSWPAASRPDVRFFDTGKVQYRYRERGSGPAIVFTADPPATLELYDRLLEIFSTRFRVIIFEPPAMGFSAARASFGFGFSETNDDIARFLEAVAGPSAILAFSCVAGLAAVDLAARRPDLVRGLVLIQTTDWRGFQIWKEARDPKRILGKPFVGQLAMKQMARSRAPMWFDLAVGARELIAPFCACASETLARGAGWTLASAYQRYLTKGPSPLHPIATPTLALWGAADRSHNADAAARASTFGADVTLESFSHVGHFPELEDTEIAFQRIAAFVDRI